MVYFVTFFKHKYIRLLFGLVKAQSLDWATAVYNCVCTEASIGYEQIVNTGLHSAVNFILTVIHSGVPRPVLTVLL